MNTKNTVQKSSGLQIEKRKQSLVLFAMFFIVFFNASFGQEIKTAIDTTSIQIGEELKLKLSVAVNATDLVVFPEAKSVGLLEVIASYKVDTLKNKSKYILNKEYGLIQFDSGHYTIPRQKNHN